MDPAFLPVRNQRRITQACDWCHKRGLKCRQPPAEDISSGTRPKETPSCLPCIEFGQLCTRLRQPKKRVPNLVLQEQA